MKVYEAIPRNYFLELGNFFLSNQINERGESIPTIQSKYYNWSRLDFLNPDFDFHKVWSVTELLFGIVCSILWFLGRGRIL